MPILADFSLSRLEDATLTLTMVPPTNISGWAIRYANQRRFGGISGFNFAYVASGFNNVSGINVTDGIKGVLNITIPSVGTSGLDYGNYPYAAERLDTGSRTVLAEGYTILLPSVGV